MDMTCEDQCPPEPEERPTLAELGQQRADLASVVSEHLAALKGEKDQ